MKALLRKNSHRLAATSRGTLWIADFRLRIDDWKAGLAIINPQSEISNHQSEILLSSPSDRG
jgi:hypothetical protein